MKNFLLVVMLVIGADQGFAFPIFVSTKNLPKHMHMPQIATVSLSKIASLKPDWVSITKALAVLPPNFLAENSRNDFYKDRIKWAAIGNGFAILSALGTGAYASFVYSTGDPSLLSQIVLATGGLWTLALTKAQIGKATILTKTLDATEQIKVAGEETNEIVIYKEDGDYHVGLLSFNDKDQRIVTDAQGNKKAITFEQLAQLAVIRDGSPFGTGFNEQRLMEASAFYSNNYSGATLAFTYKRKNYLSTVRDVTFSHDKGTFHIVTAAGEELQIKSGKQIIDKPVLITPTDSENFSSGGEIRGVLFMP